MHIFERVESVIIKEDQDIINKIAEEFPYKIDEVTNVYYRNDCSEEKTREILMERLVRGR